MSEYLGVMMFLPSLILIFCLMYSEFRAVSSVYGYVAAQSSGFAAFLFIGLSFFAMASLGGWLIRTQSQSLLRSLKQGAAAGALPKPNILAFLAGLLFIIPGYVSDGFALILLFPPSAWLIRKLFANRLTKFSESGNMRFYGSFGGQGPLRYPGYQNSAMGRGNASQLASDPNVIDVEVTRS